MSNKSRKFAEEAKTNKQKVKEDEAYKETISMNNKLSKNYVSF